MSLKEDLLKAKIETLRQDGATEESIDKAMQKGSPLEIQAEAEKEAIVKYLTSCNFTVTQLKAPIVLENFKIPDQPVNVALQTLMGEYGPLLDALKAIAVVGGPAVVEMVNKLEDQIKNVVSPLLEGGSTLPGPDIDKDAGGLESTGYVYIGEDPDSQGSFNVDDEDGQREFTTVILNEDDARKNE
tara:strand:+ start:303 stop:860 length:558 start_codon:yes stop_codon:yes gene_type:complete